jgi:hypothetical protein
MAGESEEGGHHAFLPHAAPLRIKCHACRCCWSSLLRICCLFSPKLIRVFYFPEILTLLFIYMHKSLHCMYGSADRESIVIRLRLEHVAKVKYNDDDHKGTWCK